MRKAIAVLATGALAVLGFAAPASADYQAAPKPVMVSVGYDSACAVLDDGTLWCWGDNSDGQLGTGVGPDRSAPAQVTDLSDVAGVSVGHYFACAWLEDGTAWCWGSGFAGQLGAGPDVYSSPTPVQVSTVTGLTDVRSLDAGVSHACAVEGDGDVFCWGSNLSGSVTDADFWARFLPQQVDTLSNAVAVAAGWRHSCLVTDQETVECWGGNAYGALGLGTADTDYDPLTYDPNVIATHPAAVDVTAVPGLAGVAAVTAGEDRICVTLSWPGGAKCWGFNDVGQLGVGETSLRTSPTNAVGLPDGVFASVSTADLTSSSGPDGVTCWVAANGSVWCAGSTGSGLVSGVGGAALTPTMMLASGATSVSVGGNAVCAIRTQGDDTWVSCWGQPALRGVSANFGRVSLPSAPRGGVASVIADPGLSDEASGGVNFFDSGPDEFLPVLGFPIVAQQWQVSDDGSSGWADIDGASAETLTLTPALDGRFIRFIAVSENAYGQETYTSTALEVVPILAPEVTVASRTSSSVTFDVVGDSGLVYTATARAGVTPVPGDRVILTMNDGEGTVVVSGLTGNQSVTVEVTARVTAESLRSTTESVTTTTRAGRVTAARSVALSISKAKVPTVTWRAPESTGGVPVRYSVTIKNAKNMIVARGTGITTRRWTGPKALPKGVYTAYVVASNSVNTATATRSPAKTVR